MASHHEVEIDRQMTHQLCAVTLISWLKLPFYFFQFAAAYWVCYQVVEQQQAAGAVCCAHETPGLQEFLRPLCCHYSSTLTRTQLLCPATAPHAPCRSSPDTC